MEQLEYAILTVVWNTILQRFNACSKALQSIGIELRTAVTLYESLPVFIQSVRDNFDEYEKLAMDLINCVNGNAGYRGETNRRKLRKKFFDESNSEDATGTTTVTTARQQYIVETFYVIIDSLLVALQKRKDAYMMLDGRFRVLTQFKRMTDAEYVMV